jgi:3-oxoacyl-[acyl-carrier protein] reductase
VDLRLAGKAAIVTGGSRGIGRAVVRQLAAEGCSVGLCVRGSTELDRAVEEVRGHGVMGCGVVADVARDDEVERVIAEAATALGRVDLLVVNAGGSAGGRLVTSTSDDWRETFE